MNKLIALLSFLLLLSSSGAVMAGMPAAEPWRQKVDPVLLTALDRHERVDALIMLWEQADVSAAYRLRDKDEKGQYVFDQLQRVARKGQLGLLAYLQQAGVSCTPLFIVNAIYIPQADAELMQAVASRPEVRLVAENVVLKIEPTQEEWPVTGRQAVEWGIAKIQAPEVWAMGYTGQGVVIGGQDTGYDWKHPALVRKYRGWIRDTLATHPYNWYDAIKTISPLSRDSLNPCGLSSTTPCDDDRHGTHTMGTMVGDDGQGNQIGVAPGAKWIGCRNMERGNGSPLTYLECFQWFLAPTDLKGGNPNPKMAPHVINNSWYCSKEEGCNASNVPLLEQAVKNLRAAGIVVVVSAGNSGSSCGTINEAPAQFLQAFAVGATRSNDTIASFSSRGPVTRDGKTYIKPDVSAPGVGVRSSTPNGQYASLNGTSMAGPHVAGAVALMISANPKLAGQVDEIERILEQTAQRMNSAQTCGGMRGDSLPNPIYGYGRINVLAAVKAALGITSDTDTQPQVAELRVFPNPAYDQITLETGELPDDALFELLDAAGRIQFRTAIPAGPARLIPLALPDLPFGIYFYRWSNRQTVNGGKLVVGGIGY